MKKTLLVFALLCCINTLAYANLNEGRKATKIEMLKKKHDANKSEQSTIPLSLRLQLQSATLQAMTTNTAVVLDSIIKIEDGALYKETFTIAPDGLITAQNFQDGGLGTWNLIDKIEYKLDSQGRIILHISYTTPDFRSFFPYIKKEFEYKNGLQTIRIVYNWDTNTSQWVGEIKEEQSYNNAGFVTSNKVYSGWDKTTKSWIKFLELEFEYDEANRKTCSLNREDWNITKQTWDKISKEEIKFDEAGRLVCKKTSNMDENNNWIIFNLKEQTYDSKGRPSVEEMYHEGVSNYRTEYQYDEAGRITLELNLHEKDIETNKWSSGSKMEFEYNNRGLLIGQIDYTWDATTQTWLEKTKEEYKYSDPNTPDFSAYYDWNAEKGRWDGTSKSEILRDRHGNITSDMSYSSQDETTREWSIRSGLKNEYIYNSNNLIDTRKRFNWENNKWEQTGTYTYHYSDSATGIENATNNDLSLACYPNPATNFVQITGLNENEEASLTLYSLSGQILKKTTVSNNTQVDISALPAATYILKIEASRMTLEQKIVKK